MLRYAQRRSNLNKKRTELGLSRSRKDQCNVFESPHCGSYYLVAFFFFVSVNFLRFQLAVNWPTTQLFPAFRVSSNALIHFSRVLRVSWLMCVYPSGWKCWRKNVDFPRQGYPTNNTTSCCGGWGRIGVEVGITRGTKNNEDLWSIGEWQRISFRPKPDNNAEALNPGSSRFWCGGNLRKYSWETFCLVLLNEMRKDSEIPLVLRIWVQRSQPISYPCLKSLSSLLGTSDQQHLQQRTMHPYLQMIDCHRDTRNWLKKTYESALPRLWKSFQAHTTYQAWVCEIDLSG